jgi:hypothetical protein
VKHDQGTQPVPLPVSLPATSNVGQMQTAMTKFLRKHKDGWLMPSLYQLLCVAR